MKKFRFHLLGLAHLPQSAEFMGCAFTQKNRKLARMLTSLGHEVHFYGSEGSDIGDYCYEQKGDLFFHQTHTLRDIARDYGDGDNRFCVGYNFRANEFRHDFNAEKKPSTQKFYRTCIDTINVLKKPDDFLLLTQGVYHHPIADAVGLYLRCEPGIGYRGSHPKNFRAFESASLMNFTYGSEHPYECINGNYFDRVIPNYFDPEDFEFSAEKEDYFLYIGRMIRRKGILTAAKVCNHLGARLIIVGQGARVEGGTLIGQDFTLAPGTWEYQGFADIEKRKGLLSHARSVFVPTEYMEPFAGTHVEAMLSGTPPITTNFSVFPGTIPDCLDGVVGFRCNVLNDFVQAAKRAETCDPYTIRKHGEWFLMDRVKWDFDDWFRDLYRLWESTTDPARKGWHYIAEE